MNKYFTFEKFEKVKKSKTLKLFADSKMKQQENVILFLFNYLQ
jgi:hypothetical protein